MVPTACIADGVECDIPEALNVTYVVSMAFVTKGVKKTPQHKALLKQWLERGQSLLHVGCACMITERMLITFKLWTWST